MIGRKKYNNCLARENCNKAMCASCIFRQDGNALELSPGRLDEIKHYLIGESAYVCHTTEKTCYGGLMWQATIFYRMGVISEENVDCLLDTAAAVLKKFNHENQIPESKRTSSKGKNKKRLGAGSLGI